MNDLVCHLWSWWSMSWTLYKWLCVRLQAKCNVKCKCDASQILMGILHTSFPAGVEKAVSSNLFLLPRYANKHRQFDNFLPLDVQSYYLVSINSQQPGVYDPARLPRPSRSDSSDAGSWVAGVSWLCPEQLGRTWQTDVWEKSNIATAATHLIMQDVTIHHRCIHKRQRLLSVRPRQIAVTVFSHSS